MLEMKFSFNLELFSRMVSFAVARAQVGCFVNAAGVEMVIFRLRSPLRDSFSHAAKCKSRHFLPRSPLHPPLLTAATSSLVNGARSLHLPPHFSADPAIRTRCH